MGFEYITSKSNDKIKRVSLLIRSASERKKQGVFVLEGLRLCNDAFLNGIVSDELYFTQEVYDKYTQDIDNLIKNTKKAYCVTKDVISKISDTNSSQGVIQVIDVCNVSNKVTVDIKGRYIACENVSDPSNLGAIARTAEALGLSGLVLIDHCCDVYNPKAMRASMGSLLRLPIIYFDDIADLYNCCLDNQMRLIASVVHGDSIEIKSFEFKDGDIIIIGNEANGMSDKAISLCNEKITIDIKGRAESFNAAVAASIIMWELSSR